jgi:hypothetical protein
VIHEGEWIAPEVIAGEELTFEVDGPQIVRLIDAQGSRALSAARFAGFAGADEAFAFK